MRKKKDRFIKRFAKIFGLCTAGLVVVIGLVLTGYWIFGAFNPPNVPLTGIIVNNTDVATNSFFSGDYLIINSDSTFKINPEPVDGTEKNLTLHIDSGADVISIPETGEIGEDIAITVLLDDNEKIKGGEAVIKITTETLWTTYLKVFVDVPVEDITLTNNAPEIIYPGNTFTVSVSSFNPINSQNPSNLNPKTKPNKIVEYYSTNANVATVDESTGVVNVITSGNFKIGARVFKTYYDEQNQPNESDFEYPEDYLAAISTLSISKETALFVSNNIAVDNITVTDVSQNINLLSTINKTFAELNITLNKPDGSNFTQSQLDLKKYEITAVGGRLDEHNGIVTIDTDFLNVIKTINSQNVNNTYFTIISNSYLSSSSKPCLIITFENILYDAEENIYESLQTGKLVKVIPLNIIKTDVASLIIHGNDPDDESNNDIVLELGVGDYNLNNNVVLLPTTSTYKTIKFFAKAQITGEEVISVDTNQMVEINNQMHYLISYIDAEENPVDGIIKALNVGNIQIYAVVIKTDVNGVPLKINTTGTHFEYSLDYYSAISNVSIVEKINSIKPVLKDEDNNVIEKTGDVFILSKDQVVSLDLFANVQVIEPTATAHNSMQIITDAFKYGLLTFSSSNNTYLTVNAELQSNVLKVELIAEAKVTQVSLRCFYKELGSDDSELMFEITMQIFANTISQINLTSNNLTEVTINAAINENSSDVVWDNFTTAIAILPESANVGNVALDYRCTLENAININYDTASTDILNITYNVDDQPIFTFQKAGIVYIYVTTINSESERINSNLLKIIVKTPIITVTNKQNVQGEDPLPLTFESYPGTFNILDYINVTVTNTNGEDALSANGSILQLALTQNDNNRAILGTGDINKFKVYLGQVAQNRVVKIKLFSELDTIGQVITITVKPDVKGMVAYPSGYGYEVVYSGNILDLLADNSIEILNNSFVPRVRITNLDGTKNLITEQSDGEYIYDVDLSFSTNKAYKLLMNSETETLIVQFGTVSEETALTISVQINLTTDDSSAEIDEIFSVNYIVYIKPKIQIGLNYGNDKFSYNGVDYLDIFSGANLDLKNKINLTQTSTTSYSGIDVRGINYIGDVLASNTMINYVGTEPPSFNIRSTELGAVTQNGREIVVTEDSFEKKISLSSDGVFSSSSSFISSEFTFVVEIDCNGVSKLLNIKYVPLTIDLIDSVIGAIGILPSQTIDVIDEYVVATASSNYENLSSASLKSKLSLTLVTGGLEDISITDNKLVIGSLPTVGEFVVKVGYGINEINITFKIN